MNKLRRTFILLLGIQLVSTASAQTWTVREYGSATPCNCFTVVPSAKRITITSNPSRTLKFEVYYDDGNFTPAEINDFSIDPTVTGSMVIEIAGDAGRNFGAANIAKLNFVRNDPNNNTTRVTKFRIEGDLGGSGASDTVDFDLIDANFLINQDIRNNVTIRGIQSGGLTVVRDLHELATLTILGDGNWRIFIKEELAGTLNIQGSLRRGRFRAD